MPTRPVHRLPRSASVFAASGSRNFGLGLPGVCPKDLASGPGTGDAGTVNPQMRGEPGNPGSPRMRVLLSVALRGRRAFLGAKQRLGCLEHVLGELPVGGEQLLG